MATATLPPYESSTSGASSDTSTSSTATASTPVVGGPDAAGLNPAASSVSANSLDPAIASKPLPGAAAVGATAATPPTALNEKQIVDELAKALDVKAAKGKTLEVSVADALASKYGVEVPKDDMTTEGTGTGQGTAGSLRHNIASWFDTATSAATTLHLPGVGKNLSDTEWQDQYNQALKIQSPKLREQALKKLQSTNPSNDGAPPEDAKPVPNSKALNDMLNQVATKLGTQGAGPNALSDIAKAQNLPTQTPGTPATPGGAQTAGEAYQTFVKELADPKTGTKFASTQVTALQDAGLLDKNALGSKTANGTTYSNDQIANAYQQVLNQQVTNNQTEQQALTSLASTANTQNGPTSEMQAYVQGVAQEFGVGLTTQQITQIANTYGANAATADDPSSVEDEIKDAVVTLYDPTNPANPSGVADTMYTDIQQAALQYQIPISASQIGQMVKTSLQGATVESMYVAADAAEAAATKQFQEQAQGLYPSLASQIAQGQTVQNLVTPYFNVAEALTGVPASTMMADNQSGGVSVWSKFLNAANAPGLTANPSATGNPSASGTSSTAGPQMMTMDQWKQYIMQTPSYGFQNTQGAKDMAEQMSSAILNEFGKVNTDAGSSQPFNSYNGASDLSANTSS